MQDWFIKKFISKSGLSLHQLRTTPSCWIVCLALLLALTPIKLFAQADTASNSSSDKSNETENSINELKEKLSGFEESYLETKGTVDKLSKIKISGYLQAQARFAPDTAGHLKSDLTNKYVIGEFQGGKFPTATRSVFQLRRARVKFAYEKSLSQMVIQLDCLPFTTSAATNSVSATHDTTRTGSDTVRVSTKSGFYLGGGGVTIKDAYLRFKDPWLKSISAKMGVFDRPFGFEISYSSSSRESPERSRVFQTLFPGERDLGVSLEYYGADHLPALASYLNYKGGWFAGNGINIEFDDLRDYIGRLGLSLPLSFINLSFDAGVSAYLGNVKSAADSLYEVADGRWAGTSGQKLKSIDRKYIGGDAQIYYGDIPWFGGFTLRGELISGEQPSTKNSNVSQKNDQGIKEAIYSRQILGYYAMLVLNVDPLKCQLVGKYDVFDPNTDLSESQVQNVADAEYKTAGLGLVYHWDENVKFVAYYDKVTNEKIVSSPFTADVNDDVFTFRVQYKF